jgi:hypothetical protein
MYNARVKRTAYKMLVGNAEGRGYLEDLRTDGRILICILKKQNACRLLLCGSGGNSGKPCEHGNETSGSKSGKEFLPSCAAEELLYCTDLNARQVLLVPNNNLARSR